MRALPWALLISSAIGALLPWAIALTLVVWGLLRMRSRRLSRRAAPPTDAAP